MAEEVTGEMIDALNLFVEEVQALVGSEVVKRLNGERETVRVKWADPSSPAPGGPVGDPRALHAASRILRFLEDRGEPTCLVNMDALFQRLPLSPALASRFQDIRLQTEDYLDTLALDAPVLLNGQTLKRRDLASIFVWGGLSGTDAEKRVLFEGLRENGALFAELEGAFLETLASLSLGLTHLASLCDQALIEIVRAS